MNVNRIEIFFGLAASCLIGSLFEKKIGYIIGLTFLVSKIAEYSKIFFSNEIEILEAKIRFAKSRVYFDQRYKELEDKLDFEKTMNLNLKNENADLKKSEETFRIPFSILSEANVLKGNALKNISRLILFLKKPNISQSSMVNIIGIIETEIQSAGVELSDKKDDLVDEQPLEVVKGFLDRLKSRVTIQLSQRPLSRGRSFTTSQSTGVLRDKTV